MPTKPKNPKINWAHPLTRGLQMDFLLSEGGGNNPRDLVVGSKLTNNNNDWYREFGDVGLRFDSSGEYSRITNLPPRQQFTRFLTIEVEFSRDSGGTGTVYGTLMGLGQDTTFGGRIWLLENDNGNVGWGHTLQVWWNSQPGIWSIPYPAAGKKHHLVVMYDGGSTSNVPIFILNGVRQTVTSRLGASGSLRTGGSTFALGNNAEAGGTWDGNVYRARVWNRMLSLREAIELYRNPFQIYQQSNLLAKVTNTYIESSSSNSGSSGTAVSVSSPSGAATGKAVVIVVHANTQTTITDNNGSTAFTKDSNIGDYKPNTTAGHTVALFKRILQAGDPSTFNFTLGASARWSVVALLVTNPNTTTFYDIAPSTSNASNRDDSTAATISAPTTTTSNDKSIDVILGFSDDGTGGAMTGPAGYTTRGTPVDEPQYVGSKVITPAGATGSRTMTATTTSPMIALSFAINNVSASAAVTSIKDFIGGGFIPFPR